MNWLMIKRIFRAGLQDFWRNSFISFASILMLIFTLFIIGMAMFAGVVVNTTIAQLEDKATMSVTAQTTAPEEQILGLKTSLEALPEVQSVAYQDREQVLAAFRERFADDQRTLQALGEVGNPFGAKLTITAKNIASYDAIAKFLKDQVDSGALAQTVDKINFYDPRYHAALVNLQNVTDSAQKIGLIMLIIFVLTTLAIALNTLRLAIYTSRDEIQVQRLVGASAFFIRAPFMIEGVLYGLIAGVVTLLLFYPLTWCIGDSTVQYFSGVNVFSYYLSHFLQFFLIIVGTGVALGAVASFLAVRRYLKI